MSIVDIIGTPQLYQFDSRDEAFANSSEEKIIDATGLTEVISVDVTITEEYDFGFEIVTSPVERGIDITDHKRAKPRILRMSGIVSDSPDNLLDVLAGNVAPGIGTASRSQDAYQRLIRMAKRAEPIRIVTQLETIKSMTFSSFNVRKDDAGRYLAFSAMLEEVRFADPVFGTFTPEIEATATPEVTTLVEPAPVEPGPNFLREVVDWASTQGAKVGAIFTGTGAP